MGGSVGSGQGCGGEQTPPTESQSGTQILLGECRGGGQVGSLLVTPLLLQFCLTQFSFREGRGGGLGDKEEGKRRGGLPSFFEGEQTCIPTAAPPCPSCVIWGKSLSLSEPQFGSPWVILVTRQDTL